MCLIASETPNFANDGVVVQAFASMPMKSEKSLPVASPSTND